MYGGMMPKNIGHGVMRPMHAAGMQPKHTRLHRVFLRWGKLLK